MGLSLNAKKSECMNISKNKHPSPCKVHIDGQPIQQVERFNYVGFTITSNGRCDEEIRKRNYSLKTSSPKNEPSSEK